MYLPMFMQVSILKEFSVLNIGKSWVKCQNLKADISVPIFKKCSVVITCTFMKGIAEEKIIADMPIILASS